MQIFGVISTQNFLDALLCLFSLSRELEIPPMPFIHQAHCVGATLRERFVTHHRHIYSICLSPIQPCSLVTCLYSIHSLLQHSGLFFLQTLPFNHRASLPADPPVQSQGKSKWIQSSCPPCRIHSLTYGFDFILTPVLEVKTLCQTILYTA